MMSLLPDQIVHLLVIVQDGTAILSVVLQIVSQESWALQFCFVFSSGAQPSDSMLRNAATVASLLDIGRAD